MKKIVMAMLLTSFVSFAQEFQGKAVYQFYQKMEVKISSNVQKGNTTFEKQIIDRIKKLGQKKFTLNFTKTASSYEENKELEANTSKVVGVVSVITSVGGGNEILYKNLSEKTYLNQKELMGKMFLIADTLPKSDWKLTSETKKIGKYTCYKATKTKEVEKKSLMVVDGDQKETKKMKTVVTTAWYTPQIPISNGPAMFDGLPGLILEVSEDNKTILCTELVLNPKKSIEIEKPTKGEEVTQDEFNKIITEKTEEFQERLRGRKSKN